MDDFNNTGGEVVTGTQSLDSSFAPSVDSSPAAPTPPATDTQETKESLDDIWKRVNTKPEQVSEQRTPEPSAAENKTPAAEEVKEETETEQSQEKNEFEDNRIPTAEEIDKKFDRIPKVGREAIKQYAAEAQAKVELVEKLGGDAAIPILEQVGKAIFDFNGNPDSAKNCIGTLATVNPSLAENMANLLAGEVLSNPALKAERDVFLQKEFGGDSAQIKEVMGWLKAGLFDADLMREEYTEQGFTNPRVAELMSEVEELRGKLQTEPDKKIQEEEARQGWISKVTETSDKFVLDSITEEIAPNVAKLNLEPNDKDPKDWADAKGVLKELHGARIQQLINSSQESKFIKDLIRQGQAFDKQGNPTTAYNYQLQRLKGKAIAANTSAVRSLGNLLARAAASSRNSKIADQQQSEPPTTQPQAYAPPPVSPQGETAEARQARLDAKANAAFPKYNPQDTAARSRMANGRG